MFTSCHQCGRRIPAGTEACPINGCGADVRVGFKARVTSLAFSPKGDLLAIATEGSVELRAWPSLTVLAARPAPSPDPRRRVFFDWRGETLAVTAWREPVVVAKVADLQERGPAAPFRTLVSKRVVARTGPLVTATFGEDQTLYLHGTRGLFQMSTDGPELKPALIHAPIRQKRILWDVVILPRHRLTGYCWDDSPPEWYPWSDCPLPRWRRWQSFRGPKGETFFALTPSRNEVYLVGGGKHRYIQVLRSPSAPRPQQPRDNQALYDYGNRVLVSAFHPSTELLAVSGADGLVRFLSTPHGWVHDKVLADFRGGYP